jgi:hypothetical protein
VEAAGIEPAQGFGRRSTTIADPSYGIVTPCNTTGLCSV